MIIFYCSNTCNSAIICTYQSNLGICTNGTIIKKKLFQRGGQHSNDTIYRQNFKLDTICEQSIGKKLIKFNIKWEKLMNSSLNNN